MSKTSNQEVLGNGCVCETGCPSCDMLAASFEALQESVRLQRQTIDQEREEARQLAEGWKAMRRALKRVLRDEDGICHDAKAAVEAALALAERVSR